MTDNSLSHVIADFIVNLRAAGRAESTITPFQQDLERLASILGNINSQSIRDADIDRAVVKIAASEWNERRALVCSHAQSHQERIQIVFQVGF